MGLELNNEQISALYKLEHWFADSTKQAEISGHSGTGKTTLVKYLIERIGLTEKEVLKEGNINHGKYFKRYK